MVVNFISLLLGGWVLWKAFRWFVIGSPLDNIAGPPSDSFVTGKHFVQLQFTWANGYKVSCLDSLVALAPTSTKTCWQNVRDITQSRSVPISYRFAHA